MKKIFFVLLTISLLTVPVFAQEASNSSQVTDETVKENIRERLEKVAKDENSTPEKQGWIGNLQDLTGNTITLKTGQQNRQAEIADSAVILDKQRDKISLKDLEINSYLIVMGLRTKSGVLDAKRIIISKPPQPLSNQAYFTTINTINANNNSLTATIKSTDQPTLITVSKNATITQTVDGEQSEIKLNDLAPQDKLIIIAQKDGSGLKTSTIHLAGNRQILAEPKSE